jgi:hypothetical protein
MKKEEEEITEEEEKQPKCRSQFYKLTSVVRPHIFSCTT